MGSNSGYSPVVSTEGSVRVELEHGHPGFADPEYRERRDAIAALSVDWRPGVAIPRVEYSDREHGVWQIVSRELAPKHQQLACAEYLDGAENLQLPGDRIPQLIEVTERLQPITGFGYQPVAGLAPLREFYGSFAERTFYSTQYIRHHSEPLYTPEPDIVHEVVGHANQLAAPFFADVCEEVGRAVARAEDGTPKAYGAGILSSYGELGVFQQAELRPLDFTAMGITDYDITHYQPVLYAAGSFEELRDELTSFYSSFDEESYGRLVAKAA